MGPGFVDFLFFSTREGLVSLLKKAVAWSYPHWSIFLEQLPVMVALIISIYGVVIHLYHAGVAPND
jgi:hypothetical protein